MPRSHEFDGCYISCNTFRRAKQMRCNCRGLLYRSTFLMIFSLFRFNKRQTLLLNLGMLLHKRVLSSQICVLLLPSFHVIILNILEIVIQPRIVVISLYLHLYYMTLIRKQTYKHLLMKRVILHTFMINKPKDTKRPEEDKFFIISQHLKNAIKQSSFQPTNKFFEETFSYLEAKLKSSQLLYQQALEYYLNVYLIFYSLEDKPDINIFGIFAKVLFLPTQIKQDNQKDWQEYYKPVKIPNQQIKERKFLLLLKSIVIKYRTETHQSKSNLSLLIRKAEKELGSVGMNVLLAYYFYCFYRSAFYGQTLDIQILYQPLNQFYSKNKSVWTGNFNTLLSQNYDSLNYLLGVLIGSIGLILNAPKTYLSLVLENLKNNDNIKGKLFNQRQNIFVGEVYLDKVVLGEKQEKCSTKRALIILFSKVLSKILEEEAKQFINILSAFREYLKSIPYLFDTLIDQIILYNLQNGLDTKSLSLDSNCDILIDKYKQDSKILVLLFQFYRDQPYFLKQVGNNLKQNNLKIFISKVLEVGMEQYLQKSINQEIQLALIYFYKQNSHPSLNNVIMHRLSRICQQPKEILTKITLLKHLSNQISQSVSSFPSLFESVQLPGIIKILQQLLFLYFHHNFQIQIILKLRALLLSEEKHILIFINIILKLICNIQQPLFKHEEVKRNTNQITECLLAEINISILSHKAVDTYQQHPFIAKAIQLLEKVFLQSYTPILKKLLKTYFDRPSEIIVQSKIIKNRFLLRCAIDGEVTNLLKSIYEIVHRMEDNQYYLQKLFPKITNNKARKVYLDYLVHRKLAQFRIQREKFPECKEHMLQQ